VESAGQHTARYAISLTILRDEKVRKNQYFYQAMVKNVEQQVH
jgi:hypothetical protein